MKLLLINPRLPESFWSFKWAVSTLLPDVKAMNIPLGLATLAGLCPPDWDVKIVDENVESLPLDPDTDLIGICGMGVQFARQAELLTYYRAKGFHVVAGGSYASLSPERYESLADTVVAGEAEYIWREFCRDFEAGKPRSLYHETGTVELADSPTPRLDLLRLEDYQTASMQFSRGCPYRCEFCDIIVMFGRRPRTKDLGQIEAELDALRAQDFHNVFFVDDNFIGHKKAARDLLVFLREYQERHDYSFHFGTEASLNLASEGELMELMRAANFEWVFIGIESPDEEALLETRKTQNAHRDILGSVREIYSHGLDVLAGFIIGFDNDTVDTFDRQYRFIIDSGIQAAMVGLLVALERTPLYERLQQEGRLTADASAADNTKLFTNIIPKGMSYDEMIEGYRNLQVRLVDCKAIGQRVRNKIRHFGAPPIQTARSPGETLGAMGKILRRVVTSGGARGLYHFLRSLPLRQPRLIPLAFHDWALGLATRDFVDRQFSHTVATERRQIELAVDRMSAALGRYVHQGSLEIGLEEVMHAHARIALSLKGQLGSGFFRSASRQLDWMLRRTKSGLVLRIERVHATEVEHIHAMLENLRQHSDRVVIAVDRHSRRRLDLDSSVFHVVMEAR